MKKEAMWNEIFSVWKSQEGSDPVWQRFAMEEHGWESWDAWRGYQASFINADERNWKIYDILDPNTLVPQFLMGPYNGWQKQYPEEEAHAHTFADLVKDHTEWVRSNVGIQQRAEHFPSQTQFIGVYAEAEDTIILYEGHHRAAAISLRVFDGAPIAFDVFPTIALTNMNAQEVAHLRTQLTFSTHKSDAHI